MKQFLKYILVLSFISARKSMYGLSRTLASGVFSSDITSNNFELNNFTTTNDWDFVLLGEIIEHVDNPVDFLKSIKDKFKPFSKKIIITAPNAYSYTHVLSYIENNVELINSDHRFWFTPYTILKLMY